MTDNLVGHTRDFFSALAFQVEYEELIKFFLSFFLSTVSVYQILIKCQKHFKLVSINNNEYIMDQDVNDNFF